MQRSICVVKLPLCSHVAVGVARCVCFLQNMSPVCRHGMRTGQRRGVSKVDVLVSQCQVCEARRRSGNRALLLLVSDQWGVLHAPFAVGRSYLVERGFGDLLTAVHNPLTGAVQELRCSDLTGVVPVANSDAPAANATPMEGCTVTAPCASDSVSRSSLQGGDESQAGDVAVGKESGSQRFLCLFSATMISTHILSHECARFQARTFTLFGGRGRCPVQTPTHTDRQTERQTHTQKSLFQ